MAGLEKGIHWEMCKKMKFDYTAKYNLRKLECVPENETHIILWDFEIQTDPLHPATRPGLGLIYKKKNERISHLVDFTVPSEYRVNIKESEKINKYLDLAREQRKQCNMQVSVILILPGILETVYKVLGKELEELDIRGRTDITQILGLWRSARMVRIVRET